MANEKRNKTEKVENFQDTDHTYNQNLNNENVNYSETNYSDNDNNENIENKYGLRKESRLSFENRVLEKITNYSIRDVEGVLELKGGLTSSIKGFFGSEDETKGVSAEVGEKEVALDIDLVAEYGADLRQTYEEIIRKSKSAIQEMTGLELVELNLNVVDVLTRSEFERQKNAEEIEQRKRREEERADSHQANQEGYYHDGSRVR